MPRTVLSKEQIAFEQGYAAYTSGIGRDHNPYDANTDERRAWFDGWYHGLLCGGARDA